MLALVSLSTTHLLETFGLVGLFVIVFVESGLLVGFFLPGDSLLFTAGLLAATGTLSLSTVIPVCVVAAVAGDQVGYLVGRRAGPVILRKERRFLRRDHIAKAELFFASRGGRAVLLARFVPIVRTITPVAAGVSNMPYATFVTWNVVGGVLWGAGVPVAGYVLGETVPGIDKYLLPIIGVIVLVSVIPALREIRSMSRDDASGPRSDPDPADVVRR